MAIEGKWQLKFQSSMGEQTSTMTLNPDGSGKLETQMGGADFSGAKLDGDSMDLSVTIDAMGQQMTLQITAKAEGDELNGELQIPGRGGRPITGTRVS